MTPPSIRTASWFAPLPADHIRIGISRGVPRRLAAGYRLYPRLNPGPWFRSVTIEEYRCRYTAEVLDRLDPHAVAAELQALAEPGRVPVLCCYEHAGGPSWCHRALAAAWLAEGLGVPVPELGYEDQAQDQHPLLPP